MSKRMPWIERIERAELTGKFSRYEAKLADSWLTCAVAEKVTDVDRMGPEDEVLYFRGLVFAYAVKLNDPAGARAAYEEIRAHS